MKKKLLFSLIILSIHLYSQPEITSWKLNTTNSTGYSGILSNVQKVQYSSSYVYVSATSIPNYTIGPWTANPNTATDQNYVFKITRNPTQNTGTATITPLGHMGLWSNGVSIYNPKDGFSYLNAGIWNRNALVYEGISFDSCLGHPAQNGEYHHHVSPKCLYNSADSTHHSPIIGYAFDGFPIYGAFGYTNTNGTGTIKRMTSSFVLNTGTTRANGPNVDNTYPLGNFVEDYTYTSGAGDLDIHNGRFCITPDYPKGIYAYFVTIDSKLNPVYPFVLGTSYYGNVIGGNTGVGSGHITISESVTNYIPTSGKIDQFNKQSDFAISPNPANEKINITSNIALESSYHISLFNPLGQLQIEEMTDPKNKTTIIDTKNLPSGIYYILLNGKDFHVTKTVRIEK